MPIVENICDKCEKRPATMSCLQSYSVKLVGTVTLMLTAGAFFFRYTDFSRSPRNSGAQKIVVPNVGKIQSQQHLSQPDSENGFVDSDSMTLSNQYQESRTDTVATTDMMKPIQSKFTDSLASGSVTQPPHGQPTHTDIVPFTDLPNAIRSWPEDKYLDETIAILKESFCGNLVRGFPPAVCEDVSQDASTPVCKDEDLATRYCKTSPKGVPEAKSRAESKKALTKCRNNGYNPCKSWSQQDEDAIMFGEFFSEQRGSNYTYLELGALDGISYSNTRFYEDTLGWNGVLIEASGVSFDALKKNRNHDHNALFHMAVCETPGVITFTGDDAGAGVLEQMSKFGYEGNKEHKKSEVRCDRLGKILKDAKVTGIDMWSLDVEGFELFVLRSMDWSIPVHVINIERNPRDRDIETLLISQGFRYSREQRGNRIWVNDRFEDMMSARGSRSPISTGLRDEDKLGSII